MADYSQNSGYLSENLIATLEQNLRQTRNTQSRLLARQRELKNEAEVLQQEIDAMEQSARQTHSAIQTLLGTMGSPLDTYKAPSHPTQMEEDDYELQRHNRQSATNQNPPATNYRSAPIPNNPVSYINQARNVPSIAAPLEPTSLRFSDRTITQACTLLLREANLPLHVNELYNLLCAGGFEFKGNNPTISIAVSLNRNRRFRKVAPGTFDLIIRNASQAAS